MGKSLFIAEKPSVAQEFAKVLKIQGPKKDGYIESENAIVTWCVGHLVTMSYPEVYDSRLKRWSLDTLPFLPTDWKYEIIPAVKKQFAIVSSLLNREDVETIYVCTDSGREGEYIYRLVRQEAGVKNKKEKRVWIDSQTEEEIRRGVREAKDLSAYDALADAAYLRAEADYLMGINFSRALTLKFGDTVASAMKTRHEVLSIGRVMTCVLGMVVRREREIRSFTVTPFYRVLTSLSAGGHTFDGEWHVTPESLVSGTPFLYKENGFTTRGKAEEMIAYLSPVNPAVIVGKQTKTEKKRPPLLFNLAELQNECAKRFKKSPDETLQIVQDLYEKRLVTYPRTDARVLSTAIAKVIRKNIEGLASGNVLSSEAKDVLTRNAYAGLEKTIYVDDSKITDHYAIIPTGQGGRELSAVSPLHRSVYELICRRFLCIFYPPAVFEKVTLETRHKTEYFTSHFRFKKEEGYLSVWKKKEPEKGKSEDPEENPDEAEDDLSLLAVLSALKKEMPLPVDGYRLKEGQTTPPKRYTSGSLVLAMESAGQLIEEEELREQIKGSGIGTSATRAEIIKKLVTIAYLKIAPKTQVVTPTLKGECNYEVVNAAMKEMLRPDLTASWEKGLSLVADGSIGKAEYTEKLNAFVSLRTSRVKAVTNPNAIRVRFHELLPHYEKSKPTAE